MARLVVLTPNPAVDVTYRVPRQVLGGSVRVSDVQRRAGGKGLNVLRVLAALGRPAVGVLPLGGTAGRWIEDRLREDGADPVVVPVAGETRTTVAVVDDASHPTLLSESGPRLGGADWDRLIAATGSAAEPGGFVVVAGSMPPGTTPEQVRELVTAARSAGARILVDSSGPFLLAAAEAGADVVKPNAAEVAEATGEPDLLRGVAALRRRGARLVVVSRGPDGLVADDGGGPVEQPGVPGVTGNPTGAGDAATAGLVDALDTGAPLAEALRRAAVLGAAAVLRPQAGEIDPADLDPLSRRLSGVPFRPLPTR